MKRGRKAPSDWVVEFNFTGDAAGIVRATNVYAMDPISAAEIFKARFPRAKIRCVSLGVCMLYGAPFCTWDTFAGAHCSPYSALARVRRSLGVHYE